MLSFNLRKTKCESTEPSAGICKVGTTVKSAEFKLFSSFLDSS